MQYIDNIALSFQISMTSQTTQNNNLSELENILFEGLPHTYVIESSPTLHQNTLPQSTTTFFEPENVEKDEWTDENGDDIRMYVSDEPEYVYWK